MASLSIDVKDEDTKDYLDFRGKGESHSSALKKLGYPISEIAEKTYTRLPTITSFLRLSIIYEKEGEIKPAIDICKRAIKLGLRESKEKDFSARLANLENKLSKYF